MIRKFYQAFVRIKHYDAIPKLPRGMLAIRYDPAELTRPEREIMARLGIRDPAGVKAACKRYNVESAQELIELLEHQKPPRRILHRLWQGLGRLVGGYERPPHQDEIARLARRKHNPQYTELQERISKAKKEFDQ